MVNLHRSITANVKHLIASSAVRVVIVATKCAATATAKNSAYKRRYRLDFYHVTLLITRYFAGLQYSAISNNNNAMIMIIVVVCILSNVNCELYGQARPYTDPCKIHRCVYFGIYGKARQVQCDIVMTGLIVAKDKRMLEWKRYH